MIQNLLLEAEEVHSFFLLLQIGFGRQLYGININISASFPSDSWRGSKPSCSCLSCYYYMKGFMKISAIRLISRRSDSRRRRSSTLFAPRLPARFPPSVSDVLFPCNASRCWRRRASRRPSEKTMVRGLTSEGKTQEEEEEMKPRNRSRWIW